MPKMLIDGAVEYEDGTPATEAQVCFYPFISFILPKYLHINTFLTLPYYYCLMVHRWGKMWCHFCHGRQNQKWKKGSWYVSYHKRFFSLS